MLLKIENNPDYVKDSMNNAILNTNKLALEEYKSKKALEYKINTIETDLSSLKSDIYFIKEMLQKILKD